MRRKKKSLAWSYSALAGFELCAKKYYHEKILKEYQEGMSDIGVYGQQAHKHFENRLLHGTDLPLDLMHHEPILARLAQAPGTGYPEQKLAINAEFMPTGFFDSDVWSRAVVDYMKVNDTKALIVDHKFGKMKDDFTQLKLFACFCAVFLPKVEEFSCAFYWAKEKQFNRMKFTREDIPGLWNEILPRVKALYDAHNTTDFPATPGGLCKKYCAVESCPHHGVGSSNW